MMILMVTMKDKMKVIACALVAMFLHGRSLLVAASSSSSSCPPDVECCNGMAHLCHLPVNEIFYGMAHNAMSSPSAGFHIFPNHLNDPIVESLDAGFRGISLDLCNCNGDLEFCHGGDQVGCGVGRRDAYSTFDEINTWLTSNPNEIILIHLQINEAAGDSISLDDVASVLPDEFMGRLYDHDPSDPDWPTLHEMLHGGETRKQVLFFYVSGPHGNGQHPPGVHYFYDYGMATHWSYESVDDLQTEILDNNCPINASGPRRHFFLMNDFITAKVFGVQVRPSQDAAEEVNTIQFARPLLDRCEAQNGKRVNVISVDFWKTGEIPELVQQMNSELTAPPVDVITTSPTRLPTSSPSIAPTLLPTISPTMEPTESPSAAVVATTSSPSPKPNIFDSPEPTTSRSASPSTSPTVSSSAVPTTMTTANVTIPNPSMYPSPYPTTTTNATGPSNMPSTTAFPSTVPSDQPSTTIGAATPSITDSMNNEFGETPPLRVRAGDASLGSSGASSCDNSFAVLFSFNAIPKVSIIMMTSSISFLLVVL